MPREGDRSPRRQARAHATPFAAEGVDAVLLESNTCVLILRHGLVALAPVRVNERGLLLHVEALGVDKLDLRPLKVVSADEARVGTRPHLRREVDDRILWQLEARRDRSDPHKQLGAAFERRVVLRGVDQNEDLGLPKTGLV